MSPTAVTVIVAGTVGVVSAKAVAANALASVSVAAMTSTGRTSARVENMKPPPWPTGIS